MPRHSRNKQRLTLLDRLRGKHRIVPNTPPETLPLFLREKEIKHQRPKRNLHIDILNRYRMDMLSPLDIKIIEETPELNELLKNVEVVGRIKGEEILDEAERKGIPEPLFQFGEFVGVRKEKQNIESLTGLERQLKRFDEKRLKFSGGKDWLKENY